MLQTQRFWFPLIAALVMPSPSTLDQMRCDRGEPLGKEDVVNLVRAGVPDAMVRNAIAACGVTFILDDADAAALKGTGASAALLATLAPPPAATAGTLWLAPI